MPVDRSVRLSESQLCELLAIDPARLVTIEHDQRAKQFVVVQDDGDDEGPTA